MGECVSEVSRWCHLGDGYDLSVTQPTPAVDPRVTLVASSTFDPPAGVPFVTDADGCQALVEFAGRSIYRSWDRPNPARATNESFLQHLIEVGHDSVLEHASATFYLQGISRDAVREMLRHRHFSFSELSPRAEPDELITPPAVARDPQLAADFASATSAARQAFNAIVDGLRAGSDSAAVGTKQARQQARGVLPGAVATTVVVTGNFRAWRHFIGMRATEAADLELRGLAVSILRELTALAPHVFADFRISELPDGSCTAASALVAGG